MNLKFVLSHISIFIAIIILSNSLLHAQFKGYDATSAGTGDAVVSTANSISGIYYNPAGLSLFSKSTIGVHTSIPFMLTELQTTGITFTHPFTIQSFKSGFGIAVSNFGFQLYNEFSARIGFAMLLFNRISLGLSGTYQQTFIERYGNGAGVSSSIGIIIVVLPELLFGFTTNNFLRTKSDILPSYLPLQFVGGISYAPIQEVRMAVDIEKEETLPLGIKIGLAYEPIKYVSIRTGFITSPMTITGGIGARFDYGEFNYATAYNFTLGFSHLISVSFQIENFTNKLAFKAPIQELRERLHALLHPVLLVQEERRKTRYFFFQHQILFKFVTIYDVLQLDRGMKTTYKIEKIYQPLL